MKQRRKKPIYQQLYADIRSGIEEGRFGDGGRIPTEAELQKEYRVSRHTLRQAFQDLVAEGLVYRIPGQGTFATGSSRRGRYLRSIGTIEELIAWADTEIEVLRPPETKTNAKAALRLSLSSDEVAVLVTRRYYRGVPFVVTHVYLSPEVGGRMKAEALSPEGSGTVLGTLERSILPYPVVGVSQDIIAVSASSDVSALVDCQLGEPILYVERTYFDANDSPVGLAISHYNPRRYSYHLSQAVFLPSIPGGIPTIWNCAGRHHRWRRFEVVGRLTKRKHAFFMRYSSLERSVSYSVVQFD